MKTKSNLRLIIAAVFFVGLLAWALTNERGRVPQEGEAFGIDAKTVSKLEVKRTDGALTLEKKEDQWNLVAPIQGFADKDATEKMVKAIAELKPGGERKGVDLNDTRFGLDKPEVTVTMTYEGRKTVTLYLGSMAPGGSEYFARIEGRNSLYFVPTSLRTDLSQQPHLLRDKTVVHFKQEDAIAATLQYPDHAVRFEKRGTAPDLKWFLTQPYEAKADEWNCKQVFEKLSALKADAFAPAKLPSDPGFAKPALKVTLELPDGKRWVVNFGAKTRQKLSDSSPEVISDPKLTGTMKDLVYVQLEGRPETLLCVDTILADLTKTDMDLRDKRILELKRENVNELRVERKQGTNFTVRRLPDGWQMSAPTQGRAKTSKIDDLLWDVTELEAKEFLGEQKDLQQYGLAIPETTLTLQVQGQSQPLRIFIGYAKGEAGHYCYTSQSKQVYVISDMLMLDLPKSLDELKDTEPPATGGATPGAMPPGGAPPMAPPPGS